MKQMYTLNFKIETLSGQWLEPQGRDLVRSVAIKQMYKLTEPQGTDLVRSVAMKQMYTLT